MVEFELSRITHGSKVRKITIVVHHWVRAHDVTPAAALAMPIRSQHSSEVI